MDIRVTPDGSDVKIIGVDKDKLKLDSLIKTDKINLKNPDLMHDLKDRPKIKGQKDFKLPKKSIKSAPSLLKNIDSLETNNKQIQRIKNKSKNVLPGNMEHPEKSIDGKKLLKNKAKEQINKAIPDTSNKTIKVNKKSKSK